MRVKQAEYVIIGDEPTFEENGGTRTELMRAYNWYSYSCDVSTSRKWILDYMKQKKFSLEDINDFPHIKDDKITLTLCSSCRMIVRGAKLDWDVDGAIKTLLHTYRNAKVDTIKKTAHEDNLLIAMLDDVLDVFYENYTDKTDISLLVKNAPQSQIKEAIVYYTELLNEILAVDSNPQLKEGYSHLSKKNYKSYVSFLEKMLAELTQTKINNKRSVVRKPRKRKMKSVDQLTKKVKYLTQDQELNVVSIEPQKIIGASILWTYNTKTRKLAKYQAINGQTLSIKGTTILNYDETASSQKTIRKPKEIIPTVISDAKVPLNKSYDKIKAVDGPVNGRINQFTLILRAIK